jgi:hypothetical protein
MAMVEVSKVPQASYGRKQVVVVNPGAALEDREGAPPSVLERALGGAASALGGACSSVGGGPAVSCSDEIPIYADDPSLQRESTEAVQGLRDGSPVVESTVNLTGNIAIIGGQDAIAELQIEATRDNGRIVANADGSFANEQGVVQFAEAEGTACVDTLASCSPYVGLDNSIVPLGYVRLNSNGMVILQRADTGDLVAYGRMRDQYWSDPVFRFNYDVNGDGATEEYFVVRHDVTDWTTSTTLTFYFAVSRDGKVLKADGTPCADLAEAETLLPTLDWSEAEGPHVETAGGLMDMSIQVLMAGGASALRPAHTFYEVNGSDIDSISSTPIPAEQEPWNWDFIFLVDPNRPLSADYTPQALRDLTIPVSDQFTVSDVSGRGYEPQTVGADGLIDPRFYVLDGSFAMSITRTVRLGGDLDSILDSPEPQNRIVYGSADSVGLTLVCPDEAGGDAGFDFSDGDAGE